jgi:hypothetical protein
MDDEKIEERFREIQDQIDAYTKRIGALEEDAKILRTTYRLNVPRHALD